MSAALASRGLRERGHDVQVLVSRFGLTRGHSDGSVHRVLHRTVDSPDPLTLVAYDWSDRASVRRLLRRFRPDLISIWNLEGIFPGVLRALQEYGGPLVYHLHDVWLPFHERWTREWYSFWTRRAGSAWREVPKRLTSAALRAGSLVPPTPPETRRLSHAVFCSEFARRYHEENDIRAANARVIHSGVEVDRLFQSRQERTDAPRLLYVGRFVPEKGADIILAAMRALALRGRTEPTLSLLGVIPPDRAYYERLVREAADPLLGGRVRFLAPEDNDSMDRVYAQHDVLVFPSVREGLPRTVMESMACGLALVSTPAGGTAEIVRDGDNALVFPIGDHRALESHLLRLLEQPGLVHALGQAAQRDARERFDVKRTVGQIEVFYEAATRPESGRAQDARPGVSVD